MDWVSVGTVVLFLVYVGLNEWRWSKVERRQRDDE